MIWICKLCQVALSYRGRGQLQQYSSWHLPVTEIMISKVEVHSLKSRVFPKFRFHFASSSTMATVNQLIQSLNLYQNDRVPRYFHQPKTDHRSSLSRPFPGYHGRSYFVVEVSQAWLDKDFCASLHH